MDLAFYYSTYALLALWVFALGKHLQFRSDEFLGRVPKLSDIRWFVALFVSVWMASIALNFLTFYPLGLIYPDFVSFWLFESIPPAIYSTSEGPVILPSALNLITLVVLAPIIEEVTFRGYLLHRWAHKYGKWKGTLLSSVLFGIMHPDILAAILFGIVLCVIYLRTQSLYIPILFHAAWNGTYWLWELSEKLHFGWSYSPSFERYMSDWEYGVASIVISIAIICIYLKRAQGTTWQIPTIEVEKNDR